MGGSEVRDFLFTWRGMWGAKRPPAAVRAAASWTAARRAVQSASWATARGSVRSRRRGDGRRCRRVAWGTGPAARAHRGYVIGSSQRSCKQSRPTHAILVGVTYGSHVEASSIPLMQVLEGISGRQPCTVVLA